MKATIFKIALLIIAIIVGFMYYGCESNPCDPVEKETHKGVYASVTIVQEYGYCDSNGCYGESVILYNKDIHDLCVVYEDFDTQSYIRVIGGVKTACIGFTVIYNTNSICTLDIIGTDINFCFIKDGQIKIILNYNSNYNIQWGIQ